MDAVVVDLKDFAVRTPEQVIRVFFKLYDAAKVRAELWRLFGNWAACREKAENLIAEDDAQVALLFDQLIALVEGVEHLRKGETTASVCVVCGGRLHSRGGEGPGDREGPSGQA